MSALSLSPKQKSDWKYSVTVCLSSWLEQQEIILKGQQERVMMITKTVIFSLVMLLPVQSLPPNYEDIESAVDQAMGEKVDISQEDPQSNTIHIAHNNPKDRWEEILWERLSRKCFCFSDIKVVQSNPFNTTIHISLNVGSGSKVGAGRLFDKVIFVNSASMQGDSFLHFCCVPWLLDNTIICVSKLHFLIILYIAKLNSNFNFN